ncbi:MAG: hypothetical protein KJ779_07415, partial [Firmicutes bacterium]|nr:hypothetical protein [Bacillota bacterium]
MKKSETSPHKKNKLKQISIKWKIFLFLLGFCGVLLILLWLFQVVFLNSFYKSIKINEIKTTAHAIEKSIDDENIETIISTLSENSEICIEVLSSSGDVVYSSHVLKGCLIHSKAYFDQKTLPADVTQNDGELYQYYNHEGDSQVNQQDPVSDTTTQDSNEPTQNKPPVEKERDKDTLI